MIVPIGGRPYDENKYVIPYLWSESEDEINDLLAAPEDFSDVWDPRDYEGEIAPALASSMNHKIRIKVGYLSHGRSNLEIASNLVRILAPPYDLPDTSPLPCPV